MCNLSVVKSKREELLKAAWSVIAARGVNGLRVEDVAEAVGVANSTVYYHFESRAGLLAATMDYNDAAALSAPARVPAGTGLERAQASLLADFTESKQARANNIVWNDLNAAAVFDTELRARIARVNRKWAAEIADMVRDGLSDGSVAVGVDPVEAAEFLTALQGGLVTRYLIGAVSRARARSILKAAVRAQLAPIS